MVGTTEFCTGYNVGEDEVTCKSKTEGAPRIDVTTGGNLVYSGLMICICIYVLEILL